MKEETFPDMENQSLVSIVVPIYNMEDYLEETVLSVLNSTYPNIEIILMDDASTDNSPAIARRLSEQYNEVSFYCQPNGGVASARNHAIALSHGKYIFPLDADDVLAKDFLASAVEVLDNEADVKVVYAREIFIGDKTGERKLADFSLNLLARKNMIPNMALYRKSDWERVGGYCETIIAREDWEFWISVLKDGGRVVKLPCIGLYYRIRSNSKRVRDRNMKKHVIKILNERHRDFFLRELKGPLRHYRSWSKFMNTLTNFINPFKGIVHPDFFLLSDFVFSLPVVFDKEGGTIYKGRNELKSFSVGGVEYIVKSYMTPIWVNRVIYGFLRESKAARAYGNALKLLRAGVGTPLPVGYVETRHNFLLNKSYFVSLKSDCTYEYRDFAKQKFENQTAILEAIARTTARLHDNGFLHKDYSGGNILFKETAQGVIVEIIDLNRMSFGEIDIKKGCKNFERLDGDAKMLTIMGKEYAAARGFNEEECIALIKAATTKRH